MFALNAVTLIINGFTLALALSLLLILLWYDARKRVVQLFTAFVLMVILWNAGSLLVQAILLLESGDASFGINLMEVGFSGSSIALYALVTVLVGAHSRWFRGLAFASLLLMIGYRVFLIVINEQQTLDLETYRFQTLPILFFLLFDVTAAYVVWLYRRKVQNALILWGSLIFIVGQGIAFLNPEIPIVAISTSVSGLGTLLISSGMIKQQIIDPLAERSSEIETVHQVSLAISREIEINTVLNEIVVQAAEWLRVDGAVIFLKTEDTLELANAYNLPRQVTSYRLKMTEGVAGQVATRNQSMLVENYARDWHGAPDFPYARETIGSMICVPVRHGAQIFGVLMVIAGKQGRLPGQEDIVRLERISAQAAIAISHSHLFKEKVTAHNQLQTLLTSTDNPVIAVDRKLRLIFSNPAAAKIFKIPVDAHSMRISDIVPIQLLPSGMQMIRSISRRGSYTCEINLNDRTYLCHVGKLGESQRINGLVAILNDISELKELDRLKSEMIRMVSHDLKNPLMGAMLNVELARETADDAVTVTALNVIEQQLERMNRTIRGVLDMERIRSGSRSSDIWNASQIADECIRQTRQIAGEKHITLLLETQFTNTDEINVIGDREQIERVLINLIENAIKFTPEWGKITLILDHIDTTVVFAVRDNGIGIPVAIQNQVFERFFRGRQQGTEHVSGSGLGLSIVKTIVENHQGKVWLESQEGQGSTFYVSLPAAVESPASQLEM